MQQFIFWFFVGLFAIASVGCRSMGGGPGPCGMGEPAASEGASMDRGPAGSGDNLHDNRAPALPTADAIGAQRPIDGESMIVDPTR